MTYADALAILRHGVPGELSMVDAIDVVNRAEWLGPRQHGMEDAA